ncbi:F-box only protein 17 isoform X1 [Myotis daubentonii]|uniref:F-box only protein 17 isoform X1 n=1 Tax=Myotis daubentonii TaxID=98922 RepID=UPI002872BC46|nr:F-box only protein 17 isoform X1 [Myotis daubentonii]XP_059522596.1 F-box only protein 17 isoform X1 [Myotis daubentonii]
MYLDCGHICGGGVQEAAEPCFSLINVSNSLSLSLPLCKKSIKIYFKKEKKRCFLCSPCAEDSLRCVHWARGVSPATRGTPPSPAAPRWLCPRAGGCGSHRHGAWEAAGGTPPSLAAPRSLCPLGWGTWTRAAWRGRKQPQGGNRSLCPQLGDVDPMGTCASSCHPAAACTWCPGRLSWDPACLAPPATCPGTQPSWRLRLLVLGPKPLGVPGPSPLGVPGPRPLGVPGPRPLGVPGPSPLGVPGPSPLGVPGPSPLGVPGPSLLGVPGPRLLGVPGPGLLGMGARSSGRGAACAWHPSRLSRYPVRLAARPLVLGPWPLGTGAGRPLLARAFWDPGHSGPPRGPTGSEWPGS